MKKLLLLIGLSYLFSTTLVADIYSDGTNPQDWRVYTQTAGEITTHNGVIRLQGSGKNTGYRLDLAPLDHDATAIRWKMNYHENFTVYVRLNTRRGIRYLVYTPRDDDRGLRGQYILLGLGADASDGRWHTFSKDIKADLERFDAGNVLLSISRFLIRGSGEIDDVETLSEIEETPNRVVYEDAEDGSTQRWRIYAGDGENATVSNISTNNNRIIKFRGNGKLTGYMLGARSGRSAWNNSVANTIEWRMRYDEDFTIYISTETSNGRRYLVYTPREDDRGLRGSYVRLGLGEYAKDGQWHTFSRNLVRDIHRYEPNNQLISINAFLIRGSGEVDDISLLEGVACDIDTFHTLIEEKQNGDDPDAFARVAYYDNVCMANYTRGHDALFAYNHFYTLSADGTALVDLFGVTSGSEDGPWVTFQESDTKMTLHFYHFATEYTQVYDIDPVLGTHLIDETIVHPWD